MRTSTQECDSDRAAIIDGFARSIKRARGCTYLEAAVLAEEEYEAGAWKSAAATTPPARRTPATVTPAPAPAVFAPAQTAKTLPRPGEAFASERPIPKRGERFFLRMDMRDAGARRL